MQSIAIPVVTQGRASQDYQPSSMSNSYHWDQWLIGDSSILLHAVGLAPSKDVRKLRVFTSIVTTIYYRLGQRVELTGLQL